MNALFDISGKAPIHDNSLFNYSDTGNIAEESSLGVSVITNRPWEHFIQEIFDLVDECSEENWDGYGATPIDLIALQKTLDFLRILPTTFDLPELSVDPDGQVSLDWIIGKKQRMSISINKYGTLTYAALFGNNRKFGTEVFCEYLPDEIRITLERLLR